MADSKISALNPASALGGTEQIPMVQSGADVRGTPAQLGTYLGLSVASGGSLATSGAYSITLTATGITNVSLPASGTLATTAQLTAGSISGLGSLATLSAAPAGTLSGTSLNATVTGSSLTSVGTLSSGSIPYSLLSGTPTLGSLAALSTVNNGNWSGTALSVGNGGSGLTTLTAHALQVGNGTSPPIQLAVPASGTVLQGVASSDPAFSATPTLGVQQTTQGSLTLANTAAGAYPTTIQSSNSATAAQTITLPPAPPAVNGYVLSGQTTGVTSWVAQSGGITALTANSTATSGFAANDILISDGSNTLQKLTPGANVATALAAAKDAANGFVGVGSKIVLPAGTATAGTAPLKLTSGTSLTTAEAGALEYDGQVPYFSPLANVRGVIPAYQYSKVTASGGVPLPNSTASQSFLPSGAQNFPVQAGVIYRFRAKLLLNMSTTNSCAKSLILAVGGGAAISWMEYTVQDLQSSSLNGGGNPTFSNVTAASGVAYSAASNNAYDYALVEGECVMSSAGTIQPRVQFSAAPGGTSTCMQGSNFELYSYGANSASAGTS
jgi:hypothetical protein